MMMATLLPATMVAQNEVAPVRFGIFAGLNFNSVGVGGTIAAQDGIPATSDLSDGTGLGPYGGIVMEYAPDDQVIGVHGRFGYDDRSAHFDDAEAGEAPEVEANISYWSFEPAVRFNFSPKLHMLLGPGIHALARNSLDFNNTDTIASDVQYGRLNDWAFSIWGGFGFDIPISDMSDNGNQWYLTPFIEGSWMVDQLRTGLAAGDNLDDAWSTVTVRGGLQLKYGMGGPEGEPDIVRETPPPTGNVTAMIQTPVGGVMAQRPMIEYLPLLNYVFYTPAETTVPSKYEKLNPGQASAFEENSLTAMEGASAGEGSASNRSARQMEVYYNVMNIVADRLEKNVGAKITVVGSGPDVAKATARAEDAKNYLISNFGIDATRISSRGQKSPENPSGTRATPKEDLDLVAEENVRVEIISDNYEIVKPVKLQVYQDMPIENDMSITVNSTQPVSSWRVQISGNGFNQEFGPFYGQTGYINTTPILGTRSNGTYTATVNATDRSGNMMTDTKQFTLTKTTLEPVTSTRYSVLFEYDDPESASKYDKFLRETVAPNVPDGSTVYIHGHTDVAGLEDYNYQLSVKRAEDAERILTDALKKLGRTNVTFEAYGFGETQYRAPFSNDKPETRYYNRTVMIEIIPAS